MQITMRTGTYPAAWVEENARGHELIKAPELATLFAGNASFSIAIAKGRGELFFKRINGRWHQSIHSVDQVFGHIRGKYCSI